MKTLIQHKWSFSNQAIVETRKVNENLYIDMDAQGNLVNMTIEHASAQVNMHELACQRIAANV